MSHYPKNLLDELILFNEGKHLESYKIFGNHESYEDGKFGYRFTVWAPNAKQVFLVGDFNNWQGEAMEPVFESGSWSIFREHVYPNQKYKYGIETQKGGYHLKIDPFARVYEMPPQDASLVSNVENFNWEDDDFMHSRKHKHENINIYEVHKSSWRKHYDGRNYDFYELSESLIPYVKDMGYTHIEFMPLMEHPLEASWGYQITGYFAVAARYGDALGLKHFINEAHKQGIGIILDWVPGHFNQNMEAIAYFDGTPTYEYQHPIKAYNKRWGSYNFDLGKNQVRSFLYSNLYYWLKEFHIDGVRVDAVSNMLYLDYDLEPHILNDDGSNGNHQGIEFLKNMNTMVKEHFPNVFMVAEESTDYRGITDTVENGGLGFDYKWNMGWMNDTLRFFEMDPLYRQHHFNLITFVFVYMHNENYILPLSHDEVVHGKRSILGKMPGDRYNQFAQLRVLYLWMQTLPGKSLNFMGNELGQFLEWRYYSELEWKDLQYPFNSEYQNYVKRVNHLVDENHCLYKYHHDPKGVNIQLVDDENTILVMERIGDENRIYVVLNFNQIEHKNFKMKVHEDGVYTCILNSEMKEFGGAWSENINDMQSKEREIEFVLPAYGALLIVRRGDE